MNPESPNAPTDPATWAVYDLSLPGRAEALAKEAGELRALQAVIFTLGQASPLADAFIDGVEIEREWLAHDRCREALNALRTELSSAVDGEAFMRAARRAVALSARVPAGHPPGLIYGAGVAESLMVWLTSKLITVPFAVSLDNDPRWPTKLIKQLKAEARSVRTSTLASALSSPAA